MVSARFSMLCVLLALPRTRVGSFFTMPRRSLWLLFAVSILSLACYERAERNPYGRWFGEALDAVEREYVEAVDSQKLFEGAMDGMLEKLDEYSGYLPRRESQRFQESLNQHFGGIGVEVSLAGSPRQLTVTSARTSAPAYLAGIRAGDQLVKIDGAATAKLELKDVVNLLRGSPGTKVTLELRRPGQEEPLRVTVVRDKIWVDSVIGDIRDKDGNWSFLLPGADGIGYIRITTFGEETVREFEAAMKWLADRHCRGLIIDLRENPGGILQAAERICNLFVPKDAVIVTTRERDGRTRDEYRADGRGQYQNLPLVVLVDGHSASASEIVAACLQDHHRATIVGERTWGKGTVQSIIPVEGGRSRLKLTVASYWRPSGQNIHRMKSSQESDSWGVRPDPEDEVQLNDKQKTEWADKRRQRDALLSAGELAARETNTEVSSSSPLEFDAALERAVEVLERKISAREWTGKKPTD
jgi:carboxyl-terminal processing protease